MQSLEVIQNLIFIMEKLSLLGCLLLLFRYLIFFYFFFVVVVLDDIYLVVWQSSQKCNKIPLPTLTLPLFLPLSQAIPRDDNFSLEKIKTDLLPLLSEKEKEIEKEKESARLVAFALFAGELLDTSKVFFFSSFSFLFLF